MQIETRQLNPLTVEVSKRLAPVIRDYVVQAIEPLLERIAELLYSGAMPFETASTVDSAPPYARSGELTPETIFSGGARSMASTSQAGDRAMARRRSEEHRLNSSHRH